MLLFFYVLKRLDLLRLGLDEEAVGLDASQMGGGHECGDLDLSATKVGYRSSPQQPPPPSINHCYPSAL